MIERVHTPVLERPSSPPRLNLNRLCPSSEAYCSRARVRNFYLAAPLHHPTGLLWYILFSFLWHTYDRESAARAAF